MSYCSRLTRPPLNAGRTPHIADSRANDDHQSSILEPALFHSLDDVDNAVLLADVAIVGIVDTLFFSKTRALEHIPIGGGFDEYHVEKAKVGPCAATFAQRLVDAMHPVVHRDLVETPLHRLRFEKVNIEQSLCHSLIGRELDRAAGGHEDVLAHRAIGYHACT